MKTIDVSCHWLCVSGLHFPPFYCLIGINTYTRELLQNDNGCSQTFLLQTQCLHYQVKGTLLSTT